MIVTVTAKVKIKPTETQAEAMLDTAGAYRVGCNEVSSVVFNHHKLLSQRSLHDLTYRHLRNTCGLRSQMAQSVMKTVIARYKTNRSNGHPWILVQFKKPTVDLVWNRDYSLHAGLLSVNTLQGRIKVPFERKGMEQYLDGSWKFGTARLVCNRRKWYLHIPMSREIEEPKRAEIDRLSVLTWASIFWRPRTIRKGRPISIRAER